MVFFFFFFCPRAQLPFDNFPLYFSLIFLDFIQNHHFKVRFKIIVWLLIHKSKNTWRIAVFKQNKEVWNGVGGGAGGQWD